MDQNNKGDSVTEVQPEDLTEDVVRSRFFTRSRAKAEQISKDPEKMRGIARKAYESKAKRVGSSGRFAEALDDFKTLVRLVMAYARGQYRDIPADALVVVVAGLVYVVSPVDLIPDALPGGLIDDAAVILWVAMTVREELQKFRVWEKKVNGGQVNEEPDFS